MKKSAKNLIGRKVRAGEITGGETASELFDKAFGSFVGRELRDAHQIIRRMIVEEHTIVLTFSGAMTPVDFGVSCIIPLMKAGLVDIMTTTGANLYHDMQRLKSGHWYEVPPDADDRKLRQAGLTRIYDTVFPEDDLWGADRLVCDLIQQSDMSRAMTTPEFHYAIARHLAGGEVGKFGKADRDRSILVQAYELGIPIFCGSPQDSSIFLNLALLKRKWGDRYRFSIDMEGDIHEYGAYHYYAKKRGSGKLSIIILGGGVPKNYALQPEPYLQQICGLDVDGYDSDVQVCDAHVQNGGLSSCTASEAHTWGKTSEECVQRSQYVFSDVTAVFPFIVHALLQEGLNRKSKRLFDHRGEAIALLDHALKL
jgi:deoxyhypusine synthase